MAVSSFCRACGEHFRIEKGVAILPPGARVSGIVPIEPDEASQQPKKLSDALKQASAPAGEPGPHAGLGQTWFHTARQRKFDARHDPIGSVNSRIEPAPAAAPPEEPPIPPTPEAEIPDEPEPSGEPADLPDAAAPESPAVLDLGREAQPVETLRQGSMSAMFGGVIDRLTSVTSGRGDYRPKMPPTFSAAESRRKGAPQTRLVRCFECNHQQQVSIAATSTQCARCSIYISLVDHDITGPWSQNIRTRGSVKIRKKGNVSGCDIACHHLEVDGHISASVDCSGDAVFRNDARIMGNMYCRHLHIDKRCEVAFPQGVIAETADIHGTVLGNITCAGTVRIFKSGKVEGNAIARSIDLKDGGILSGRMSIQPNIDITLPEKKGYLKKD